MTTPDTSADTTDTTADTRVDTADRGRALLRSGGLLAVATMMANAGNYLLNLVLGRWLTPAAFADATLMVTLMLCLTSIAVCLQLVAARYVGIDPGSAAGLVATLRRRSWLGGIVLGGVLAVPAPFWAHLFQAESSWPFVVLGAGIPFYLAQAVGRGVLQGEFRFARLSASLVVEMVVRLAAGLAGVLLGFGVTGVTVGLSLSLVATWLVVRGAGVSGAAEAPAPEKVGAYVASVAVLLTAQIVLNNADVLVAKATLPPQQAGLYSALALVGRAVFFLSWAAATVVFPAAARRHANAEDTGGLLIGGCLSVAALGAVCTLGAWTVGGPVLGVTFGPEYAGLSDVLAIYALMATFVSLANIIAVHHLSTGRVREIWVLLGGGVLQVALLLTAAPSIDGLVRAQFVATAVLLPAMVLCALTGRSRRTDHPRHTPTSEAALS